MNDDTLQESLSALVDGELPRARAAQVLDAVMDDPELRAQWRRHHLIAAVLSGQPGPVQVTDEFATRVAVALENVPAPSHAARRYRRVWVPVAMAAGVGALAVAATALLTAPTDQPVGTPPARVATGVTPPDSSAPHGEPADAAAPQTASHTTRSVRMTWSEPRPAVEARLNAYLLNHNEYLAGGVRGMLPYARVVGYDARD